MSLTTTLKFVLSHPLNADHKLSALAGFVRWQVASRLMDADYVFPWVNGSRFRVRRGQTGITANIYAGLQDFEDMAFLLHYLRPDDLFADVGANVGAYTVLASSAAGARTVAIEPVPATYYHLLENVRLNHCEDRVRCVQSAIGDKPGTIRFTTASGSANHVLAAGESAEATELPLQTLDTILSAEAPRLLKIDVEGYEAAVIAGAPKTLGGDKPQAIIMEINHLLKNYGFTVGDVFSRMSAWGFTPCMYDPINRNLRIVQTDQPTAYNTLFVRDVNFARQRVTAAKAFTIRGRSF